MTTEQPSYEQLVNRENDEVTGESQYSARDEQENNNNENNNNDITNASQLIGSHSDIDIDKKKLIGNNIGDDDDDDDEWFYDAETGQKHSKKYLRFYSYLVLLGGFLVLNCVGSIWAFGNIVPYMASYWTWLDFDKNPPLDDTDSVKNKYDHFTNLTVWSYTVMMICWSIFGPFGGQFSITFGPRLAIFIGALFTGIGTASTYFTIKWFVWTTITFCAAIGASNGMSYTPPMVVVMRWWPYNRAIATTILMSGSSAASMWIDSVETGFINPSNVPADTDTGFVYSEDVMKRFPKVFIVLGSCFFTLMTIGSLLMKDAPNGYGMKSKSKTNNEEEDDEEYSDAQLDSGNGNGNGNGNDETTKEALTIHHEHQNAMDFDHAERDILTDAQSDNRTSLIGANTTASIGRESNVDTAMLNDEQAILDDIANNEQAPTMADAIAAAAVPGAPPTSIGAAPITESNVVNSSDNTTTQAIVVTRTKATNATKNKRKTTLVRGFEGMEVEIEIPRTKEEVHAFMNDNIKVFDWNKKETFSSLKFFHISAIDFFNAIVISFVAAQWKVFANEYLHIKNDTYLARVGAFAAIFQLIGRLSFALIFDHTKSFRLAMSGVTMIFAVFTGTICLTKQIDGVSPNVLLLIWICILQLPAGGNYALYASAVSQAFGITNSGVVIAALFFSEIPATIGQAFLFSNITGIVGSWFNFTVIMAIGAIISTILALTFDKNNSKKVAFLKKHGVWHLY